MPGKRTRIALYVMVTGAADPEIVARQIHEEAIKPYVAKRYGGQVLPIPVGEFTDMPVAVEGPDTNDGSGDDA